ncbi:helix-turn-helix domain-containing protein [Candidatus Palauibacter sp.]|uniref:helix-turn-helix domain-containing protein n=1 Tax=Candidatus Palauibacter sp. TaxID=3101350 RepID=UPI003B02E4E5
MGTIVATSRTPAVLRELGARLRTLRLHQNLRVKDLAARAGVGARTIDRVEAGHSVGTGTLVRIMRGLGRVQAFEALIPPPEPSPYEIEQLKGKLRQRASGRPPPEPTS